MEVSFNYPFHLEKMQLLIHGPDPGIPAHADTTVETSALRLQCDAVGARVVSGMAGLGLLGYQDKN